MPLILEAERAERKAAAITEHCSGTYVSHLVCMFFWQKDILVALVYVPGSSRHLFDCVEYHGCWCVVWDLAMNLY